MPHRIRQLRREITNDPLGRGYASMTDAEVLADLLLQIRAMPGREVTTRDELEATFDPAEVQALRAARKRGLRDVLNPDNVSIHEGSHVVEVLKQVFSSARTPITWAALKALRGRQVSRAVEEGLQNITVEDITRVRAR